MTGRPVEKGAGRAGPFPTQSRDRSHLHQPSPVRVLVADDDEGVRRAIARLVSSKASLEIVGMAKDAEEAVDLGRSLLPDVALVDVRMPKGGGVRAARELLECSPRTKVLALSGLSDREAVLEMLSTGAVGYLVKGANIDVAQAILSASRGEGVISNEVAAQVIVELSGYLTRLNEQETSYRSRLARIEKVLEDRAIEMIFQPVFDLRTSAVAGVEALARFAPEGAPDLGTPDRWFAEAWHLGLGLDLEILAISLALESARLRPPDVFVAVNASPDAAVTSRFCDHLVSQEAAETLVVELTEHAVVDDYDALGKSLDRVRRRGVRIAVDDAGAGYASLRHILRVKPEFIKLDVSLISEVDKDASQLALAARITAFARDIGTKVVAEGIENASQLECVSDLGVDYGQGFHLGLPGSLTPADLVSRPTAARKRGP